MGQSVSDPRHPRKAAWPGLVTVVALLFVAACSSGGTASGVPTATPAAVAPSGTAAPTQALSPIKLRFGYIPGLTGGAIAAVGEHLGLWAKYGLDVQLVKFTSGPPLLTAMAAGQLDVGYIGNGAMWGPPKGLATIIAIDEISLETFIIAQPGSGVTRLADLRGKTVGTPTGSAGDLLLELALSSVGLTNADIVKLNMDPATVVSSFVSGKIDVASIWTPPETQILQSVPNAIIVAGNRNFPNTKFVGAMIASNGIVKNNPEAVRRFLGAFIEANDYRKANLQETIGITSAFLGIPADQLAATAKNIQFLSSDELFAANQSGETLKWIESLVALFPKTGQLTTIPSPSTYVNLDLFNEAKTGGAGS